MHTKKWKRGDDASDQGEHEQDDPSDPTESEAPLRSPPVAETEPPKPADESGDPAPFIERPAISPGDIGPDVLYLQQRIGVAGTGKFDALTETAVVEFKRTHDLPADDGTVDAATWQKIEGAAT